MELEEDRVDQGNFSAWHSLSLRQGKGHPSLKEWAFKKCFICIYFVPSPNFFQGSKSTLQSRPTVGSKLTTRQRLNILVSNRSISPVLPDCWGSTKNNVSVLMVLILCLYTSSAFSLSDFWLWSGGTGYRGWIWKEPQRSAYFLWIHWEHLSGSLTCSRRIKVPSGSRWCDLVVARWPTNLRCYWLPSWLKSRPFTRHATP